MSEGLLVAEILAAIPANRPRADVGYCIHGLCRRLSKTRNWIVAIKTLIVVHRTLREGDPACKEELIRYSYRGKLFQLYNFNDDTSTLAWDGSAWVRTYSLFLEERVECFKTLQYDLEVDRASKPGPQASKTHSKTLFLNGEQLLENLPSLQQLLYRLICCQFFGMPKHDAVRALDIYRRGKQAAHLADFYAFCRTLHLARTFHFPTLKQPPPTFVATMEDYIKEAPQMSSLNDNRLLNERRTMELHSAGYSTSYGYGPGMQMIPLDQQQQHFDPFAMSNNIPPPANVQMALMAQQEQMTMHQQQQQQQQQLTMMMPAMEVPQGMNMEPYNPYAAPRQVGGYFNPFGDPFNYPQPAAPLHGKNNNTLI